MTQFMMLTDRAKTKIVSHLKKSELVDPVAAILWASDLGGVNSGWTVGFYERAQIRMATEWIVVCDNIEFFIDPSDRPKIDGKTLDYVDEKFRII